VTTIYVFGQIASEITDQPCDMDYSSSFLFVDPKLLINCIPIYAAAMMHSIACLQMPVIVASGPYTCSGLFKA
jgi:hypothetical protein